MLCCQRTRASPSPRRSRRDLVASNLVANLVANLAPTCVTRVCITSMIFCCSSFVNGPSCGVASSAARPALSSEKWKISLVVKSLSSCLYCASFSSACRKHPKARFYGRQERHTPRRRCTGGGGAASERRKGEWTMGMHDHNAWNDKHATGGRDRAFSRESACIASDCSLSYGESSR